MRSSAVTIIALSCVSVKKNIVCHGLLVRQPFIAMSVSVSASASVSVSVSVSDSATQSTVDFGQVNPWPYSSRHSNKLSRTIMSAALSSDDAAVPNATEVESKPNTSLLTNCKLTYFGIPGRGEAIRLALAIGGVEFEDERVPFPAWGRRKPSTPWGTLPVLELADGSQLAQARSVLRFVGKHTGLYPADELVAQRVDELMDALEDLAVLVTDVGRGLPKHEMEAHRRAASEQGGVVYDRLAQIDAFIGANGGTTGYAVGDQINIATILTFTSLGRLAGGVYYGIPQTICQTFNNIQTVRNTVANQPAVIAWYDARIHRVKSRDSLSPAEQILACRDIT